MTVRPEPPPLPDHCFDISCELPCGHAGNHRGGPCEWENYARVFPVNPLEEVVTQLRADVARLTEETTRLQSEVALRTKDNVQLVNVNMVLESDIAAIRAERDALRQGIAQFRTWLKDERSAFRDSPRLSALSEVIGQLDTLLPHGEATD